MLGFSTYAVSLLDLQSMWALSNTESGLVASAFFIGYMACVSMWNAMTDHQDPRQVYFYGSVLAAAGSLGFGLAANGFVSAFFWQFLLGAGVAATYMPGLRILSESMAPGATQSRYVSFYTAFFGIGAALSFLLAGWALDVLDWRWSFGLSALGPLIGLGLVLWGTRHRPRQQASSKSLAHTLSLFFPLGSWKKAWREPALRGYTIGYGVHCLELFGSRAWTVAFISFGFAVGGVAPFWVAATWASFVNLISTPASILGNEMALRIGRRRWINWVMASSSIVGVVMALLSDGPWWLLLTLVSIHSMLIMADSATLTAGMVSAAPGEVKGAAMGLYSLIGFGSGAVGPAVFGIALDMAGGGGVPASWAVAFAAIGLGCVLYPFAERFFFGSPIRSAA